MNEENGKIRKTNPFKELDSTIVVPDRLRPRIMQSINMAKVVIDIAEMFTVNYTMSLAKLFSTEDKDFENLNI